MATTTTPSSESPKRRRPQAAARAAEAARRHEALVALGGGDRGGKNGLVYEKTAAALLGITPKALRDLIQPAKLAKHQNYASTTVRLYDPCVLLIYRDDVRVVTARGRRGPEPVDYVAKFERQYASRREAVADAMEALWNLNRYAKHPSCSRAHRSRIYELKNRLLAYLCGEGYLIGTGSDSVVRSSRRGYRRPRQRAADEDQDAFRGHGVDHHSAEGVESEDSSDEASSDPEPPELLHYKVLQFRVNGRPYTWHHPAERVTWHVPDVPLLAPGDWSQGEIKPVTLAPKRFAEKKALIAWVTEDD